jgi:hypothetical protein
MFTKDKKKKPKKSPDATVIDEELLKYTLN